MLGPLLPQHPYLLVPCPIVPSWLNAAGGMGHSTASSLHWVVGRPEGLPRADLQPLSPSLSFSLFRRCQDLNPLKCPSDQEPVRTDSCTNNSGSSLVNQILQAQLSEPRLAT